MKTTLLALTLLFVPARIFAQEPKSAKSEIDVLYDEDQKDRDDDDAAPANTPEAIDRFLARDARRRGRARELLDAGALKTGRDFEKAAFIFQHGTVPDDFLLAHVLAMVAMAKGNLHAKGIAVFTLDRYLQNIQRPIVLGPGWTKTDDQPWTQAPFNRTLVPDSLRKELGIQTLEQQAKELAEMNKTQPK
jgi:hypothetical protein